MKTLANYHVCNHYVIGVKHLKIYLSGSVTGTFEKRAPRARRGSARGRGGEGRGGEGGSIARPQKWDCFSLQLGIQSGFMGVDPI